MAWRKYPVENPIHIPQLRAEIERLLDHRFGRSNRVIGLAEVLVASSSKNVDNALVQRRERRELGARLRQVVTSPLDRLVFHSVHRTSSEGAFTAEALNLVRVKGIGSVDDARIRLENALAQEVRIMLEEGVVDDASQIDLAMIVGAGWPLALGGICGYLDYAGVSRRVNG